MTEREAAAVARKRREEWARLQEFISSTNGETA